MYNKLSEIMKLLDEASFLIQSELDKDDEDFYAVHNRINEALNILQDKIDLEL